MFLGMMACVRVLNNFLIVDLGMTDRVLLEACEVPAGNSDGIVVEITPRCGTHASPRKGIVQGISDSLKSDRPQGEKTFSLGPLPRESPSTPYPQHTGGPPPPGPPNQQGPPSFHSPESPNQQDSSERGYTTRMVLRQGPHGLEIVWQSEAPEDRRLILDVGATLDQQQAKIGKQSLKPYDVHRGGRVLSKGKEVEAPPPFAKTRTTVIRAGRVVVIEKVEPDYRTKKEKLADLKKLEATEKLARQAEEAAYHEGLQGASSSNTGGPSGSTPVAPKPVCFNCGRPGHLQKECEKQFVGQCYNCNESGHVRAACPKPPQPSGRKKLVCLNCGNAGHHQKDCPEERVGNWDPRQTEPNELWEGYQTYAWRVEKTTGHSRIMKGLKQTMRTLDIDCCAVRALAAIWGEDLARQEQMVQMAKQLRRNEKEKGPVMEVTIKQMVDYVRATGAHIRIMVIMPGTAHFQNVMEGRDEPEWPCIGFVETNDLGEPAPHWLPFQKALRAGMGADIEDIDIDECEDPPPTLIPDPQEEEEEELPELEPDSDDEDDPPPFPFQGVSDVGSEKAEAEEVEPEAPPDDEEVNEELDEEQPETPRSVEIETEEPEEEEAGDSESDLEDFGPLYSVDGGVHIRDAAGVELIRTPRCERDTLHNLRVYDQWRYQGNRAKREPPRPPRQTWWDAIKDCRVSVVWEEPVELPLPQVQLTWISSAFSKSARLVVDTVEKMMVDIVGPVPQKVRRVVKQKQYDFGMVADPTQALYQHEQWYYNDACRQRIKEREQREWYATMRWQIPTYDFIGIRATWYLHRVIWTLEQCINVALCSGYALYQTANNIKGLLLVSYVESTWPNATRKEVEETVQGIKALFETPEDPELFNEDDDVVIRPTYACVEHTPPDVLTEPIPTYGARHRHVDNYHYLGTALPLPWRLANQNFLEFHPRFLTHMNCRSILWSKDQDENEMNVALQEDGSVNPDMFGAIYIGCRQYVKRQLAVQDGYRFFGLEHSSTMISDQLRNMFVLTALEIAVAVLPTGLKMAALKLVSLWMAYWLPIGKTIRKKLKGCIMASPWLQYSTVGKVLHVLWQLQRIEAALMAVRLANQLLKTHADRMEMKSEDDPLDELDMVQGQNGNRKMMFAMLRNFLPVHLQAVFLQVKQHWMEEESLLEMTPIELAKNVMKTDRALRRKYDNLKLTQEQRERGGFYVKRQKAEEPMDGRACVCCNNEPPKDEQGNTLKYRWKYRMCDKCEAELATRGAVSPMGVQVLMNLTVPSGPPGMIQVPTEQYPAKKSKMDTVDLRRDGGNLWERKGDRWVELELRDMKRFNYQVKDQWGPRLLGIGISGARPMVSAKTSFNAFKAVAGRVFQKPKNTPRPGIWEVAERWKSDLLPDLDAEKMLVEDWIHSMPARRRKPLQRALLRYETTGWTRAYGKFKAFVKQEALKAFTEHKGQCVPLQEMLDRLIQGPADEAHIIAGPWMKPMIRKMKKKWDNNNCIFYGGTSPGKLQEWLEKCMQEDVVAFGNDYAMYDNTHSRQSWKFMEGFYRRAIAEDPDFVKVLEAWRAPRGYIDKFKYQAPVMNASGRDDTALANAVLNGFAMFLSLAGAWFQIDPRDLEQHHIRAFKEIVKISITGDDTIGFLPRKLPNQTWEEFGARVTKNIGLFGFEAKFWHSDNPTEWIYLGMRPYLTQGVWRWGKTIGRAIFKMGWRVDNSGGDPMAWLTGVAQMNALCNGHVPILADMAQKVLELRQGLKITKFEFDPNKPWTRGANQGYTYDQETIRTFVDGINYSQIRKGKNISITVEMVNSVIDQIKGVTQLPWMLDDELLRILAIIDDE